MDAKSNVAGLYSMDQREPPGHYPALERAFWKEKRHILIVLANTYSSYILGEYEQFLTECPELPHRIMVIAEDLLDRQAGKTQG